MDVIFMNNRTCSRVASMLGIILNTEFYLVLTGPTCPRQDQTLKQE